MYAPNCHYTSVHTLVTRLTATSCDKDVYFVHVCLVLEMFTDKSDILATNYFI